MSNMFCSEVYPVASQLRERGLMREVEDGSHPQERQRDPQEAATKTRAIRDAEQSCGRSVVP